MDSRIREAYEAGYSRWHNDTVESRVVSMELAAEEYIESLLTAEPEPCEDARAAADSIRSYILSAEEENDHGIACLECWNSTYKLSVSEIISRVADKRAEVLRAENDRLKKRIADLEKECAAPILVNIARLADQLSTAREQVDTLKRYTRHTGECEYFSGNACNCGLKEALSATEPKPSGEEA